MATGTVGNSGRERSAVAPNSPSEMVNAKAAATIAARPISGRSISRHTRDGLLPSTAAACRSCGRMLVQAGSRLRMTKGKATRVCASGSNSGEARRFNGG